VKYVQFKKDIVFRSAIFIQTLDNTYLKIFKTIVNWIHSLFTYCIPYIL